MWGATHSLVYTFLITCISYQISVITQCSFPACFGICSRWYFQSVAGTPESQVQPDFTAWSVMITQQTMPFYIKTKKLFLLSNNFIILLKTFFYFISSSSPQMVFWSFFCAVFYKDEIKHSAAAQIHKTHLRWVLRDVHLQHPLDCPGRICNEKGPKVQLPNIE